MTLKNNNPVEKKKKNKTPSEVILQVINWMREKESSGFLRLRTASEAIEHFNLDVSEASVNGWLRKRGLDSNTLMKEAIETKKREATEMFIKASDIRKGFRNRGLSMLSNATTKVKIEINGESKLAYAPPNLKQMKAINEFNEAIDNLTGVTALEKIELLEARSRELDREFKEKRRANKAKEEIARLKGWDKSDEANNITKDRLKEELEKMTPEELEELL